MSTTTQWRMRISLRTFLVAFSAVAIWLGWNVFIVEHRKQVLRDLGDAVKAMPIIESYAIPADGPGMVDWMRTYGHLPMGAVYAEPTTSQQLPWIRRKLGDKPYLYLAVYNRELIPTVCRWFPEAVCVRKMVISNFHRQLAGGSGSRTGVAERQEASTDGAGFGDLQAAMKRFLRLRRPCSRTWATRGLTGGEGGVILVLD